ncbi:MULTISPECIES: V-type ATP synthase subunit F [Aerococcus]|uniref:V-type ATP synthase subunit F n=2 Tax=Aerococcus TaxID=1375 RepID=A0A178HHM6_9LACT|nr:MULTISPECIES: V-type ATP synthase subunit F [Aerococcus]KAA9218220.1 V-type ATP synthase subunit F [Aerococcus loyolae]KAA9264603.1 V-type ATP synthase subunit F [Aerococcus loyolae]MCY3026062.1 V-type ATP synthase subunit F [Aerococcus loyolae]MCY3027833.1 V-type ATP synthase subunit F [Aerococcus loyolae]MCY3029404.1 V-type ATP synthase subunit F [Aerococcus loyolae]
MKQYLISDNVHSLTGMKLVGVDGVLIKDQDSFEEAFQAVLERNDIGVLMISPQLIADHQDLVDEVRFNRSTPLIVEMLGPNEYASEQSSIADTIQRAIGISI